MFSLKPKFLRVLIKPLYSVTKLRSFQSEYDTDLLCKIASLFQEVSKPGIMTIGGWTYVVGVGDGVSDGVGV